MNKRLKIAIPAAQVLIAFSVFAWYSLAKSVDVSVRYAYPARDIIIKLNFPVLVFWSPILYLLEHSSLYPNPSSTAMKAISFIFFVLAFAFSIALFWYFVIAEYERRCQNKSMIRFTNWFAEVSKDVILFTAGGGAICYALFEGRRLFLPERSKADAVIGGIVLLTWGVLFIAISFRDFVFFLRTRGKTVHRGGTISRQSSIRP